jgi:hypothetical protein
MLVRALSASLLVIGFLKRRQSLAQSNQFVSFANQGEHIALTITAFHLLHRRTRSYP